MGGGFSISQGGGSASVTAQYGHADGDYAGVNEQAGLYAGDGGYDVNVKGNTALTGAVISSTADAAKNNLSTGTLTFSDIENHSHYSANSIGGSMGLSGTGTQEKAVGPASVPGSGGLVPMIGQNDSGDSSATTRSAISAGTINVTNQAAQTQDVASLSRDATDTNGTVANTPDVNDILNRQADTMQAAQAASQVVSQGIGAYADKKRDDAANAVEAAANSNDPQAMAAALVDYANWREGGDSRAALQAGGGALIGGLGGGAFGAFGGAAGAAISSKLADQTKAAADAVTGATGSSLIGNIGGNILSGLAGGMIGGSAGAAMASNVNLYNQSTDTEAAAKDARVKGIVAQALGNPSDFNSVSLGTLIDQFVGQVKSGAQAKMPESPSDLAAQGIANGLNAVVGTGGGKPPAANPGAVLADSTAANAVPGTPGYVPSYATFNSGGGDGNADMLGANGAQFASKTVWKGDGKERIDVENPNPGQRPGQIHYQDNQGNKYLYDPSTNSFPDAPNSVNKLLNDPSFNAAIQKGLNKYLGGS